MSFTFIQGNVTYVVEVEARVRRDEYKWAQLPVE
jgi:hypothetical protein